MSHPHPHHESSSGHHEHSHRHVHGPVDASIASTAEGMAAIRWSFLVLLATATLQLAIVLVSGSVALLADTIHNFADAATAIPLGIAFWLTRRRAPRHFTYGFGRAEDLAGVAIVLTILGSSLVVAYESIDRLLHPRTVQALWAVAAAAVVGFLGNEGVAVFRIRVGRKIGSAALIADGYHARADGWTSLAVLAGAALVRAGYPAADAAVGLLISLAILVLVWQSGRTILTRLLDGVQPETLEAIRHSAGHARGVEGVTDVRVRWIGHGLHAEVSITVPGGLSVADGHAVAREVRHQLLHEVRNLVGVMVHVDPSGEAGEEHHEIGEHEHDGLPVHRH